MAQTDQKTDSAVTGRLVRAIGHPVRFRILEELNERAASPSEVAEILGLPVQRVAYHFGVLAEQDAIEFVGTKPSRGALKRVYRATERPLLEEAEWMTLPPALRRQLFNSILNKLWEHVVEGARSGGFEDPKSHVTWTAVDLDREGYEQVAEILTAALEQVLEAQAQSATRLSNLPDVERELASERSEVAILHYHRRR